MNGLLVYNMISLERSANDPALVPEGQHECDWFTCSNIVTDMDFFLERGSDLLRFCSKEHMHKWIDDSHQDLLMERELGN